jgi:hypothetical protein
MALGQLADYRRFIHPALTCAILLPQPPRPDLAALLKAENVVAIWQTGAGFEDSVGGTST